MRRKKISNIPEWVRPHPMLPMMIIKPTSHKPEDNEKPDQPISAMRSSYQQFTKSLTDIIREEPWKQRGYPSIKAFCKAELTDIDYTTLIRHKKAMAVHERLEPDVAFGTVPAYVYREILKVDDEDQAQVWALAKQLAGKLSKVRPQHIRKALTEVDLALAAAGPNPKLSKGGMGYDQAVKRLVEDVDSAFGTRDHINRKTLYRLFRGVEQAIFHHD